VNALAHRIVVGQGYIDGMRFVRVMAGEYRADLTNGWTYTIDRHCEGRTDCSHSHECWLAQLFPSYGVCIEVGRYRTLTEAKIGATQHAVDEGVVTA
jgi:hypothetical protein